MEPEEGVSQEATEEVCWEDLCPGDSGWLGASKGRGGGIFYTVIFLYGLQSFPFYFQLYVLLNVCEEVCAVCVPVLLEAIMPWGCELPCMGARS